MINFVEKGLYKIWKTNQPIRVNSLMGKNKAKGLSKIQKGLIMKASFSKIKSTGKECYILEKGNMKESLRKENSTGKVN